MLELIHNLTEGSFGWSKYLAVFVTSIFKYFFGVAMAYPAGFSFLEIMLTACLGGIFGVVIFTYFGAWISRWIQSHFTRKKPMKFSHRRMIIKIWRRFGIYGVAFLAPIISPPVSVAIALSFRSTPREVIVSISVSLILWSVFFATFREGISQWTGW